MLLERQSVLTGRPMELIFLDRRPWTCHTTHAFADKAQSQQWHCPTAYPQNSQWLNSPTSSSFFLLLHIMSFANFYNDFFTSKTIWKKYIYFFSFYFNQVRGNTCCVKYCIWKTFTQIYKTPEKWNSSLFP